MNGYNADDGAHAQQLGLRVEHAVVMANSFTVHAIKSFLHTHEEYYYGLCEDCKYDEDSA